MIERVGNDKIPVNYGMNALAIFSEMRSMSINDTFELDYNKMNLMDLLALLYAGVKDGARKAGEDCKFDSLDDFIDYADNNQDIINLCSNAFARQRKAAKGGKSDQGDKKK
jgi:hypothetical protein